MPPQQSGCDSTMPRNGDCGEASNGRWAVNDVTSILSAMEQGDPHTAEQLLPLVYDELKKLAAAKLAQEGPGQTLQATALVHEAYLRLVGAGDGLHWNNRRQFFMAAAEAMRRSLGGQRPAQAESSNMAAVGGVAMSMLWMPRSGPTRKPR